MPYQLQTFHSFGQALRVSAGSSSWSDKGIESRDRQSSEHAVDEDGEENEVSVFLTCC